MIGRWLYSAAWYVAAPLIVLRLLWRARKQPEYLHHLGERIGLHRLKAPARLMWVHAVSVGETRAAQPLVRALLDRYPQHSLLLTQMTPTGRATAHELFGADPRVCIAYLPYDTPGSVRRFLRHFRPAFGVLMETEVWPNLLRGARREAVPMLLANARLSARSARGYARLGGFARAVFGDLAACGAQTEADAVRLRSMGASPVTVTGNLKFEISPPAAQRSAGAAFRAAIGTRPVVVASNTRPGEEGPLLDAYARHASPDVLLILVPRHPQRFDEIAQLVEQRGLSLARRSSGRMPDADTRVWLGDSMGEMFAYYASADVAIVGGSWAPLGGHNLIEACAVGVPALVGPHTFNFAQAAADAIDAGAAIRCADLDAAVRVAVDLLKDAARRSAIGAAGQAFSEHHKGALAATLGLIETLAPHQ
ncbi:lipid IV(A) 3-deoxy-D-manno-octulosonic acid transferase [Niveibacterium sp. 24ML]|uniref:lipid IV(A) 3-deoxy-D-manno-octulosonic acid transferase n=1 Tax=Niveibacterium sp. 24ML TaxID=2985512 RepID=UPI00226DC28D|nr:lipid IV(A) 3-deoxy-D-manno-octulosonic acid transferase [Niveibacterium sp. 24ML]MCX9154545.1 lipid IV(A) 3-deoxy-D-manno-octulosonic acid transferase [Niveibacterium sp. 24ML]